MVLLGILFIVVPIVELYIIIQVGQLIGLVPTLLLLVADAVLGALLLRHQGRGAWQRFNLALQERRFPGREVADGLMIAIGATLLLTPGFITDIFGLILLIPPTRAMIRRLMRVYVGRRFLVVGLSDRAMRSRDEPRTYDYDGTAEEVDRDDSQLPGGRR